MGNDDIYVKRSVYRELFNNACADYSIYRLNHPVDLEFERIEGKLWEYRENSLSMELDDIKEYDTFLAKAKTYLAKKELLSC